MRENALRQCYWLVISLQTLLAYQLNGNIYKKANVSNAETEVSAKENITESRNREKVKKKWSEWEQKEWRKTQLK